jgi:hypothetical protein
MRPLSRSRFRGVFWLLALILAAAKTTGLAAADKIGVYYFPGWKDDVSPSRPRPWDLIKPFPEKEPVLGWYPEGDPDIMKQQLSWMMQSRIDFVVFDWYYQNRKVINQQAVQAYKAVSQNSVKYSIMWCNAGPVRTTADDWQSIVSIWIDNYLNDSNYLMISGKPAVFIQSGAKLGADAALQNQTLATFIAMAQAAARARGLPGIFFVVGYDRAASPLVKSGFANAGVGAISAYNYVMGAGQHGYSTLDKVYRRQWSVTTQTSPLPIVVPMMSGWDRRPWGGSADPANDRSLSRPDEFVAHLKAARQVMQSQSIEGNSYGVICCWNEFGEGSYIEPTKGTGFSMLNSIKGVFGGH